MAVYVGRVYTGPDPLSGTAQTTKVLEDVGYSQDHTVSAANTAVTLLIGTRNMAKTLAISMVASAGTATVTISASVDNVNYITIDSLVAALTTVKQYTEITVGAGVALSPLSFAFIKIVVGAAGLGNTTTLDVAMK